jgi:DNA repair exonuclease SbcCD nuclease subunit
MRFSFIHAADLHIDSPLAGLSLKDAAVAQRFAEAGRRAVEALVEQTIASEARFLILAGDIFDGDWKDVSTGYFFARVLGALHRANIPVFIVKGNHDAASVMSRELPYADSVHTFDSRKAETVALDDCRVALHGRSFPNKLTADFVERYPARRDGWLNIGVLHTSLDGTRGHDGYAPCGVEDLKRFGYDYWALGHVHAAEIVSRDPWIVYPGNLQGRSVRETGPKGAMRVSVDDGRIVEVTPLHLDGARWAHVVVDVSGAASEAEAVARVREALADSHAQGEGRPLAARVTLTGASPLHNHLVARREALQDELRACGFQLASDCWVEQLKIRTAPPAKPLLDAADALDVEALLAAAAADPEFAACVGELIESVTARLPADLQAALLESDALRRLAQDAPALLAGELS